MEHGKAEMSDYNGFTNYATWAVALHGYDDAWYADFRDNRLLDLYPVEDYPDKDDAPERKYVVADLAQYMEASMEELLESLSYDTPELRAGGIISDLIGWAVNQIDWLDLARNYASLMEAWKEDHAEWLADQ